MGSGPVRLLVVALLLVGGTVLPQAPAEAATQSTCNGAVCTEVTSSSGVVTAWRTTVYPGSGYNCETARFWVNGGIIDTDQACGTGVVTAYASTPYYLSAGSRLCTSFVGQSGYACITL